MALTRLHMRPMIPFGSVVMAHVPLKLQATHGDRAILNYAVGTALRHIGAKGGLILFNPLTKRDVIRRNTRLLDQLYRRRVALSMISTKMAM